MASSSSSSSSTLLSLVLLLSAASWGVAHAYGGGGGVKRICLYIQEITKGPNATSLATVLPQANTTFGMIELLDNEMLDGPDPSKALLLGRFQGMVAFAGKVTPPGMQSVISFIFTAGRYQGSTLVMAGTVVSFKAPFERAIVGGTGKFRMARGWCVINFVWCPTKVSKVYEVNLYVKTEGNQMALNMDG